MNNRYFACPACREYIDAGYRWAYWALEETGVVTENEIVDVAKVLACEDYWNVPADEWAEELAYRLLPAVRRFLEKHRDHWVFYLNADVIWEEASLVYNWTEIEP